MSNFKEYRNKETGEIVEGELLKHMQHYLFQHGEFNHAIIYLTKRHFQNEWEEVTNDKS